MTNRVSYEAEQQEVILTTPQFDELQTLRASGLAALYGYEQAGLRPASTLDRTITLLSSTFEGGDYTPETVWSLTQALRYYEP